MGNNPAMGSLLKSGKWWLVAWCVTTLAGALLIAQAELGRLRESFETDARIAHRLMSQRAVEHDAVLATLALLQPAAEATPPEQRLPSVYPQILSVQRSDRSAPWSNPALRDAEARSRLLRRPVMAQPDLAHDRYQLVLAAEPASFALLIDLRVAVPWNEWPTDPKTGPARMTLALDGQEMVLQPGHLGAGGWHFNFRKHLAAESQPMDAVAERQVGWAELPWLSMAAWALGAGVALGGVMALRRQREQRLRAEELLRLGHVARLNTLGELAAGMAHELNQPLTAVLASTQAAQRLLAEEPPELASATSAMGQAAQQARRAADVLGRLRRSVERPDSGAQVQAVSLQETVRNVLHLLAPECARRRVEPGVQSPAAPVLVMAEPVALEQIVHNLLMNALQAMEATPPQLRSLALSLAPAGNKGVLTVADTGPGIAPELLPRIFEPFFSTRSEGPDKGLGLGLSLCETLASNMGGSLTASHNVPRGAVLTLNLPLATSP